MVIFRYLGIFRLSELFELSLVIFFITFLCCEAFYAKTTIKNFVQLRAVVLKLKILTNNLYLNSPMFHLDSTVSVMPYFLWNGSYLMDCHVHKFWVKNFENWQNLKMIVNEFVLKCSSDEEVTKCKEAFFSARNADVSFFFISIVMWTKTLDYLAII